MVWSPGGDRIDSTRLGPRGSVRKYDALALGTSLAPCWRSAPAERTLFARHQPCTPVGARPQPSALYLQGPSLAPPPLALGPSRAHSICKAPALHPRWRSAPAERTLFARRHHPTAENRKRGAVQRPSLLSLGWRIRLARSCGPARTSRPSRPGHFGGSAPFHPH